MRRDNDPGKVPGKDDEGNRQIFRAKHPFLWMAQAGQDLQYALRSIGRTPGFTAAGVLTLALGIGANTAVFSVINAVLLRPLGYPTPDRIVQFYLTKSEGSTAGSSIPDLRFWLDHVNSVEKIAAYDSGQSAIGLTSGIPEEVHGIHVTANYFALFGAPFLLGRSFNPIEDSTNGPRVVVLSYGIWKTRYSADENIVGKVISLDKQAYTVIGVAGATFHSQPEAQLWIPFQMNPNSTDQFHSFFVAARLRPGLSLAASNAQLDAASQAARKTGELPDSDFRFQLRPLRDAIVGGIRHSLLILQGAVGLVLLIACANLANLVLVRMTSRRREFAIRAAIGARSGRIVRQLLVESLLLNLFGCTAGTAAGVLGVNALLKLVPGDVPRIANAGNAVGFDWRVMTFAAALSILTGLVFAILPAWAILREELTTALQEAGSRQGRSVRSRRSHGAIFVSEVALSLTLLIGAALLLRTFYLLNHVNPGFDSHHVLMMTMPLGEQKPESAINLSAMVRGAREQMTAIPGVEATAATFSPPFASRMGLPFTSVSGGSAISGDGDWLAASPGYFEVLRIPILRGREIDSRDVEGSPAVAMINQAMARRFWPHQDALGQQITIGGGLGTQFEDRPRTIIGVFGDTRDNDLSQAAEPTMVIPDAQMPNGLIDLMSKFGPIWWMVRTHDAPQALMASIPAELAKACGGRPVGNMRTMDESLAQSIATQRFNMWMLAIFAFMALALAFVGVYGIMAYSVVQRTREIGVRMALGASRENMRNMILYEGLSLGTTGVICGVMAAFIFSRVLAGLVYGVSVHDRVIFIVAPIALELLTTVAAFLPARRAAGLDPVKALRFE